MKNSDCGAIEFFQEDLTEKQPSHDWNSYFARFSGLHSTGSGFSWLNILDKASAFVLTLPDIWADF